MLAAHSPPKSDYITVLAIYDDPPCKNKRIVHGDELLTSKLSIPINGTLKPTGRAEHVINDQDSHTTVDIGANSLQKDSFASSSADAFAAIKSPSILRNSGNKTLHKNENHSVHFEGNGQNSADAFHRDEKWNGNSRKSRITNSFLDAKESIEFEMNQKWPDFDRTFYQLQRIVLSSETQELPLGLEVSPVPNQSNPSRLLAVEVRSIEEKGRIADDGRLRIGDQLVQINETSCDMISFARVQLRLRELQSIPNPSFAFFRRISQPKHPQKTPQRILPVTTALQIGNTSQIGETKSVYLKKSEDGFGFTYAGRESFANNRRENLYYVKGLRKECGGIAIGDRILQIDQMPLSEMGQSEVTSLLKSKSVGDVIELLISRNVAEEPKETTAKNEKEDHLGHQQSSDLVYDTLSAHFSGSPDLELHCLDIPLNDTPGAGLGLSLKAQRVGTTDSGLFIRSILHGSAAFKDGRLQVNDRLVGIENQNLLNYELNGEALEAFVRTISQLPQFKHSLRLFVLRKMYQSNDSKLFGGGVRRGSDSDLSQLSNFDREAPSRRSISEKRPLVTRRDPSQLRTYQRIVHQRQISAPALSSTAVANANRSRRSLYDELRRVRSSHAAPSTKKQRPKTVFYVDEAGKAVTSESGFSSTFPPNTVRTVTSEATGPNPTSDNAYVPSAESAPWHFEKEKTMPSSTSQPLTLSEFAKSAPKNRSPYLQCHDESEPKQTKNRRGSLGNGLFKLFGRGSTHKEKDDVFCRVTDDAAWTQQRPPPPPYRLSPTIHQSHHQQQLQHCPPCQCSPTDHYCHQQCSHNNPDPMAIFGLHHRTNNCTRLHQFSRLSFHPTPTKSSAIADRPHHFHSPLYGLGEVPHSQNDTHSTAMCHQHQQWPYPIQSFHRSQRQDMPTQPSQLAWTTMIRSTPGSLPGRVPHDLSAVSEGGRQQRQQSLLFRSKTVAKHRLKPSAVFYDLSSDWVIRC